MSHSTREIKVVIVGGGGVGKSASVIQFVQGHFVDEYDPTIEDSYRKQTMIDDTAVLFDILDTAGMEEYSAMRDQYMRSGEAFVLMYSVTARASLEEIDNLFQQIMRLKEKSEGQVPLVLVGNKIDMENERKVTTAEGEELAAKLKCLFFEASAKTRVNIDQVYAALFHEVRRLSPEKAEKARGKKRGRGCLIL